jgi:hypothetical protein
MMILGKHGAAGSLGKRKPYDAEIEYLESTGTQYIYTGIIPQLTTDVYSLGIAATGVVAYGFFAGVEEKIDGSVVQLGLLRRSASNNFWYVVNKNQATPLININERHDATIALDRNGGCRIDSVTFSIGDTYNTVFTLPLYVGALNGNGKTRSYNKMRLYHFSVKRNGVKIIDLIPVRKGDIGYMYDRVSGELFGNDGTGEFILGNA